eukprot:2234159-Prymnesium_polylepis.1
MHAPEASAERHAHGQGLGCEPAMALEVPCTPRAVSVAAMKRHVRRLQCDTLSDLTATRQEAGRPQHHSE